MVEDVEQLKALIERQKQHIKELQIVIERYKRENSFLKVQQSKLDNYTKLRIAQDETLSLIEDVEKLKKRLVRNGEVE